MLQRRSVGFLCCRVPELCGYGRAVRPFGAVCACALGAAVQEAEPVLPSAHNIDLVTSTRYFTANALIYLCSAHLCGDCSSICSWTRVTAGAHDPHKHQQTLPLSLFARCISSLLVEMSQEYEYDLVTIGAGAVLHWLHMMTECCAAAIMTGCTRSGFGVLNAAPVKHLGYFKISACLYRAPAHDPTCIYPPATISPPTTATAGSGGVRASRFAAQYYNAKVAVVELPFDFVSSDDKGGAYTHVRHPHCSFVWHCLHMPSKAGCAGRCVPPPLAPPRTPTPPLQVLVARASFVGVSQRSCWCMAPLSTRNLRMPQDLDGPRSHPLMTGRVRACACVCGRVPSPLMWS